MARQTRPYFTPRLDAGSGNEKLPVPEQIMKALLPTSGGYIRHAWNELPTGAADGYFFFWEPQKDNFNILWHHPERCMSGAGWRPNGPVREVEIELNGRRVSWFAFPFKNDQRQVLQLWGAWRNGVPVIGNLDIKKYDLAALLSQLRLFSTGNSATEIVSCSAKHDVAALTTQQYIVSLFARQSIPG